MDRAKDASHVSALGGTAHEDTSDLVAKTASHPLEQADTGRNQLDYLMVFGPDAGLPETMTRRTLKKYSDVGSASVRITFDSAHGVQISMVLVVGCGVVGAGIVEMCEHPDLHVRVAVRTERSVEAIRARLGFC